MKYEFIMPTGEIQKVDRPEWKTPFNHNTNFESDRTATFCAEPSLTKQEFAEEADINTILKRFLKTGEPPPMALPEHFVDTTTKLTHHEMQTRLAEANAMFYTLNAQIRAEHQNDPTQWADAVTQAVTQGDGDALDRLGIDTRAERAEALRKAQAASDEAAKAAQEAANKSNTEK